MVGGPVVVIVAVGIFAATWLVVLLGSRYFGPQ